MQPHFTGRSSFPLAARPAQVQRRAALPARVLAPHVQAAIAGAAQRRPAPLAPSMAPHVQAALARHRGAGAPAPRALQKAQAPPGRRRPAAPSHPSTGAADNVVQAMGMDPLWLMVGAIALLGVFYALWRIANGPAVPLRVVPPSAFPLADDCSICLSAMGAHEDIVELPCGHRFHRACILESAKGSTRCPLCRYDWNPLRPPRRDDPGSGGGGSGFSANTVAIHAAATGGDILV